MRRASAAGSCPGSSPSGRLLMIVGTPAAPSASMSDRSSLPAALTPGANANSWAGMPILRDDLRAASQPQAVASPIKKRRRHQKKSAGKKSGGELRRALHKVAGADPEPLQAAECGVGALQIFDAHGGVRQHFGMAPMHRSQAVAQPDPLFGQADMDRTPVVQRALLRQIPVFDHLLDVVRDVRAEIAAPQCELADRHLRVADIEQHHSLNVVDVVDPEPFELELYDLEKMAVESLDERNHLQISGIHPSLACRQKDGKLTAGL